MTIWHWFIPVVLVFGAWTADRFVHLIWAGAFFLAFLVIGFFYGRMRGERSLLVRYWKYVTRGSSRHNFHALAMAIFVLFLGSWLPDIDWKFGIHRSPLTHSALPYLILAFYIGKPVALERGLTELLLPLFGVALGSHLIVDLFQGGNLVSVPAEYEIAYYIGNGILVCVLSYLRMWAIAPAAVH